MSENIGEDEHYVRIKRDIFIQDNTFPVVTLFNLFADYSKAHDGIPHTELDFTQNFLEEIFEIWPMVDVQGRGYSHISNKTLGLFTSLRDFLVLNDGMRVDDEKFTMRRGNIVGHDKYETFIHHYIKFWHGISEKKILTSPAEIIEYIKREDTRYDHVYNEELSKFYSSGISRADYSKVVGQHYFEYHAIDPLEYAGVIDVFRRGNMSRIKDIRYCAYKFI